MTSKPVALLLDLGVTQAHARPHVSNDNPFRGLVGSLVTAFTRASSYSE